MSVFAKEELLEMIESEIEDRGTQAHESGEPEKYREERRGLAILRDKVEREEKLDFNEYNWLADLVSDATAAEIREELEMNKKVYGIAAGGQGFGVGDIFTAKAWRDSTRDEGQLAQDSQGDWVEVHGMFFIDVNGEPQEAGWEKLIPRIEVKPQTAVGRNMARKQLVVNHSTYGKVKVFLEVDTWQVLFFRTSRKIQGEHLVAGFDKEGGGNMGHPNPAVDAWLRSKQHSLLDLDETGYIELEQLLLDGAKKLFPDFFKKK